MIENVERIAKLLSIVAIPIVLGVGGWFIQQEIASQSIKKEYVQLAISVLTQNSGNEEMRAWAVELLNHNSPIPFSETTSTKLTTGELAFLGKESMKLWQLHINDPVVESKEFELNNGATIKFDVYENGDVLTRMGDRIICVPSKSE